MAQIDIGKLKPTWKSAYNNSTAYVVDDMVSYQSQSYICKLASTGNVPTNTTYWDLIAGKGTDGTDADLAAISGTVQGDLYYNNGSAIARLAPGTSGHFLKTQGASANPVWAANESNYEKLYSVGAVAAASEINLNGYFNDAYDTYRILGQFYDSGGGGAFYMQMRTGTNGATNQSGNDYHYAYDAFTRNSSGQTQGPTGSAFNTSSIRMGWNGSNFSNKEQYPISLDITIHQPNTASRRTAVIFAQQMWDNTYFGHAHGAGFFDNTTQVTGLRLSGSNNISANYIKVYGYK